MANIILIASGQSMIDCGYKLKSILPKNNSLTIVEAVMENAVEYVQNQLPENTDVIIARGNTARLLKNTKIPVPVVTIPIKDSELIASIEKASSIYQEDDGKIAYIGLEKAGHKQIHTVEIF